MAEADRANRIKEQQTQYAAFRAAIDKPSVDYAAATTALETFAASYFVGIPPASNVASYKEQIAKIIDAGKSAKTDEQHREFHGKMNQFMHDYATDDALKAQIKVANEQVKAPAAPAPKAEAKPADKPAAPKTPEQLEMEKLNEELKRDKATLSGLEKQQNQQEAIKKKKHEIKIVEAKIKLKNAQISAAANPNDKNLADAVKNAETELSALTKEGGGGFMDKIGEFFKNMMDGKSDFSWGTAIAALIAGLLGSTIIGGMFEGVFGGGILGTVLKVGVGIATAFMGAKMWSSFTSGPSSDAPAAQASGKGAQPARAQGQVLELSPNIMSEIGQALQNPKLRPDLFQILPNAQGKLELNLIENTHGLAPNVGMLITPEALKTYTDKRQFNIPVAEIVTMSAAEVAKRRTHAYGVAPQAVAPAPVAAAPVAAPPASLSTTDKSFLDSIRDKVSGWGSQTQQSDSIPAGEAPGWIPGGATPNAAAARTR